LPPDWWLIRFTTSPFLRTTVIITTLIISPSVVTVLASRHFCSGHSDTRNAVLTTIISTRILRHRRSKFSIIIRRVHIAILRQTDVVSTTVILYITLSQLVDARGPCRRGRDRRSTAARGRDRGRPSGWHFTRRFHVDAISCQICSENFRQLSIVGSASGLVDVLTLCLCNRPYSSFGNLRLSSVLLQLPSAFSTLDLLEVSGNAS